jgi:hypothetical protein
MKKSRAVKKSRFTDLQIAFALKQAVSSVIINQANKQFFEPALPRNWMLGVTAKLPL